MLGKYLGDYDMRFIGFPMWYPYGKFGILFVACA